MRDVPLRKPREEMFCQLVAQGVKPTQAYKDAGFAPGSSHASRLNGRPHIKDRIAELRGHTAAVTNTSRESLMLDTIKAQAKAENEGHLVAWIRAIELRAKLAGLLVDRVAINSRVHYAISDEPLSDAEWAAKWCSDDKWRQNPKTSPLVIDAQIDKDLEWKQRYANEAKLLNADTTSKN